MRTITRQFLNFCLRCMTFTRTNPLKKFKFHACIEELLDNEPEIRCNFHLTSKFGSLMLALEYSNSLTKEGPWACTLHKAQTGSGLTRPEGN